MYMIHVTEYVCMYMYVNYMYMIDTYMYMIDTLYTLYQKYTVKQHHISEYKMFTILHLMFPHKRQSQRSAPRWLSFYSAQSQFSMLSPKVF
jgi:hypothetical protein